MKKMNFTNVYKYIIISEMNQGIIKIRRLKHCGGNIG
ncbi:hypothetical protein JOC70_000578 [Clostridium pascui]|nr:hypothetical protein [Clostridium pascui]